MHDLRAGPVLRADEFAADDSVAIDDVGLGPHIRMKQIGGRLLRIAYRNQIDMAIAEKARIGVGIFINADRNYDNIGILMVELEQRRHLLDTWWTPCSPEVEQHNLAAIVRKVDRRDAVVDREIRRFEASLGGMRASIATRKQC